MKVFWLEGKGAKRRRGCFSTISAAFYWSLQWQCVCICTWLLEKNWIFIDWYSAEIL